MGEQGSSGPIDLRAAPPLRLPVRVRDVMTPDPVTASPATTVPEMAQLLLDRDIRCLPVVDVGDVLVGVVSEADLISHAAYPLVRDRRLAEALRDAVAERLHHWADRSQGLTAGEIMTAPVETAAPEEPLAAVARKMLRDGVRVMPVVEDGRLVGVVSRHDVLGLFARPDPEVRAAVEAMLGDPRWVPDGIDVHAEVRDGVVVLTGTVPHPSDVEALRESVGLIPGVVEVAARVTPAGPEPRPHFLLDRDWR